MGLPLDAKIITWWDGEPIWRHKTPEERAADQGIDTSVAQEGIKFLGHRNGLEAILKKKP